MIGDVVYGILNLSFHKTGQPFSKNDEMVLSILFRNISAALENAILQSKVAAQMEKIKGHNLTLEKEIEGRIRIERALRESEHQYRLLVENSSDIIYTITLTGHFMYMNPVAERMTGFPQSDLVGKHYFSLVHPDYHETLDALYKKQFYEKIPNTYSEFPIIVRDGAILWIGQNVQLLMKDDRYIGFQAAARDITARRLAEEHISSLNIKLAKANKELETAYAWMRDNRDRLIADQSKDLIAFLVDREGLIIGMTEEVLRYIDWPRDRIIGVKITDLLLEEYRAPFMAEMGQAWIDMDKQISVGTILPKEEFRTVKVKMTRLTLDTRRLLLVTMQ